MSKHYETGSAFPELKKGTLRLYSMRFCPYAYRARLVLLAKNIPHEIINIHLQKQPEWFTARTPVGAVPVLEHDDGRILYESLIICDYLDTIYPTNRLTPSDPFTKAQHQILIELFSSKIVSPFYGLMGSSAAESAIELNSGLEFIEQKLVKNYFGGDSPAMVDYMIWPFFSGLFRPSEHFKFDAIKYPKLAAYYEKMKELPAIKATTIDPNVFTEFMKSYINGEPNYDI